MNEKTNIIITEADNTEGDNEKITIHGLKEDIGELRRSIQHIDGEHGSPTNTSTPIVQTDKTDNAIGKRTTNWISDQ